MTAKQCHRRKLEFLILALKFAYIGHAQMYFKDLE